jgi:hypothetical protein
MKRLRAIPLRAPDTVALKGMREARTLSWLTFYVQDTEMH